MPNERTIDNPYVPPNFDRPEVKPVLTPSELLDAFKAMDKAKLEGNVPALMGWLAVLAKTAAHFILGK